jgi:hypothetical protein
MPQAYRRCVIAFTRRTLTHTFKSPSGAALAGSAEFTLSERMSQPGETILPEPVTATFNAAGEMSVELPSNKDAETTPGDTQYRLDLRIVGQDPQTFWIVVPTGPGTTDLYSLLPLSDPGNAYTYDTTTQWATFLDLEADVKPWLQFADVPVPGEDAKLRMVVDDVCQWLQEELGRPLGPTTFAKRFSVFNSNTLMLPYYPIVGSPIRVAEFWGVNGEHLLEEQTPEHQGSNEMYTVDPLRGYLVRSFQGLVARPWFPGVKNIEVVWQAGFDPLPATVRNAALKQVAHEWRKEQQASRGEQPRMMGEDGDIPPGLLPEMLPAVKARLSSFTQVGIG